MAKIKHIAISSQNPEKTAKFFKNVFDLEEVGAVNSANASGFYLSDGNINLAILKFHNDVVTGPEFDSDYSGIHHIGFQVDDAEATEARLKKNDSQPMDDVNDAAPLRHGQRPRRDERGDEVRGARWDNDRHIAVRLGWDGWGLKALGFNAKAQRRQGDGCKGEKVGGERTG